ncbi:hypothetical protein ACFFHM_19200 [Halalkalibacter kiskunsagensis]|uniref:Uncharacterized protein n=1 Tax=Halalkalibacter kiskunsagensis TaxID=1548599 RepID=A0ABV6KGX1_9BACI
MSLLILFIIVAIIVVSITLFLRKSIKIKTTFFNGNGTKWLLVGYLIVLIASFFIYQTIAIDKVANEPNLTHEEFDELYATFQEAARNGTLDSLEESFVVEDWRIEYEEPTIHLNTRNNNHMGVSMFAERKETNDGEIEVYYYTSQSSVEGIDITEEISRINLEVEGETMMFMRPTPVDLRFAKFTKEFTITQFTGERQTFDQHFTAMAPEILYLKIPKDLEIVDYADFYIQEVVK